MKRFLKLRHGEKGFTLIELLVVVAILGVLAAVVVPNVVKFMGSGQIEAANTEAHDVQTAVVAYMADNNIVDYDDIITPPTDVGPYHSALDFLVSPQGLQAEYTIVAGAITAADASAVTVTDSKWGDLVYTPEAGWAKPTTGG